MPKIPLKNQLNQSFRLIDRIKNMDECGWMVKKPAVSTWKCNDHLLSMPSLMKVMDWHAGKMPQKRKTKLLTRRLPYCHHLLLEAGIHTPVERIAWPDEFVEHGKPEILRDLHKLTAAEAVTKCLKHL